MLLSAVLQVTNVVMGVNIADVILLFFSVFLMSDRGTTELQDAMDVCISIPRPASFLLIALILTLSLKN